MGRWAYESAKKAIREKPGIWAMVPSVTGRWGRANAYARAKKWATEGFDVRVVRIAEDGTTLKDNRSTYYFYARWPEKED